MKNKKIKIKDMQQLAKQRGGMCLSNTYHNQNTKLLWQCEEGHQWWATLQSVRYIKSWCPVCAKNQPLTIKEMQQIAQSRKGKCLSKKYINSKTKLLWKCKKQHRWQATPHSIKTRKSWCPQCAGHKKSDKSNNLTKLNFYENNNFYSNARNMFA